MLPDTFAFAGTVQNTSCSAQCNAFRPRLTFGTAVTVEPQVHICKPQQEEVSLRTCAVSYVVRAVLD